MDQKYIDLQNSFKIGDEVKIKTSDEFDIYNECLMRYQAGMDRNKEGINLSIEEAYDRYNNFMKETGIIVDIFKHWYWIDNSILVFEVEFKNLNMNGYFFYDEMEKKGKK